MNRKIIAGLCSGAMAAVSFFAFAGCGGNEQKHKHVYKDYYELADCTDMGYTLHCCTKCDYMYADDFVMPYEHAYEHCVNFALPVTESKATVYADGGVSDSPKYITVDDLPTSVLISNPVCEVSQAQQDLIKQYCSELLNDRLEQEAPSSDKVITFTFEQLECPFCGDYKEKVHSISVPILSTVPTPQVDMGNATLNFSMDLEPDVGSGAFDGAEHGHRRGVESRTVSVGSESAGSSASVPATYRLSPAGELSHETVADADDLVKDENSQPLQLTMADCIEEIGANAFVSCSELKRAELPSALKKIGANAFSASKLEYAIIPSGLNYIGTNAFGDCKNMKYLFYCGTQAEWDEITFEKADDAVKSVPRYYYSESAPASDGNFWHFADGKPEVW